jgi:hypothetical protein
MNALHKYKLSDKVTAFREDNCNTNFEGAARKGTNNVFAKLKTSNLKTNIQSTRYAAHILCNALQTTADILSTVVDATVNKIFLYSDIYTVRAEELKEFCDFADIKHKQILGRVKARWLPLEPAVTSYYHVSRNEIIFFPKKNARRC